MALWVLLILVYSKPRNNKLLSKMPHYKMTTDTRSIYGEHAEPFPLAGGPIAIGIRWQKVLGDV
jgi:hypothetical protein